MNSQERNDVIHRWQNGQSVRSIASDLNLGRYVVTGIIRRHTQQRGAETASQNDAPPVSLGPAPTLKSSKLDPFAEQLTQLLERYPTITATRAFEELQRSGYDGGYTILRERIKHLRKTPPGPLTIRFETAPGVQAQMDWATYTIDFTVEGKRRVNLFSYILGYSRRQYICFTETMEFETTIRQHIKAFEHLGGVATTCLPSSPPANQRKSRTTVPLH